MPPRPFPFPLRVGTDIVSINRIREAITRRRQKDDGNQFRPLLNKIFTRREQQIFHRNFPDFTIADTARLSNVAQHIAGRWAAKEAMIKAAKPRKLVYLDVEVLQQRETREMYGLIRDKTFVHNGLGVKRLKLNRETLTNEPSDAESASKDVFPTRKEDVGEEGNDNDPAGQMVAVSISHDSEYATAVCIAPLETMPGDVGGEAAARMYDAPGYDSDYWKQ